MAVGIGGRIFSNSTINPRYLEAIYYCMHHALANILLFWPLSVSCLFDVHLVKVIKLQSLTFLCDTLCLLFGKGQRIRQTHFIDLPVVTPASRPRVRSFLESLMKLPAPDSLPAEGIRPMDTLHLRIGALSLSGDKAFEYPKALLQRLDLKRILRAAGDCAMDGQRFDLRRCWSDHNGSAPTAVRSASSHNIVAPLQVNVGGLFGDFGSTYELETKIINVSHRSEPFCRSIRYAVHSADSSSTFCTSHSDRWHGETHNAGGSLYLVRVVQAQNITM